jgi:two-component system sensor histidine kinase KdpD
VRRWAVAILASLMALALSLAAAGLADNVPWLLFVSAVAISGWYGGLGPALLATFAGFVTLDFFFESPPFSFVVSDVRTPLALIAFLVVAIALGSLNARLRIAHDRAQAARSDAELALKVRDAALATVSHDLRTPLTAIKTSVSTLRSPGRPLTDATRHELLGTIEAEVDRLSHFVSDALALSRLEAGIVPNLQWNSVDDVISASLDHSTAILGERPVTFDPPSTLPLARFDPGLLDRALTNVLDNVGVHTPAGSPVTIGVRVSGTTLCIEVSDAGPGIPLGARQRVFEKFERLDAQGLGAGLGLAIARAATEAQGGDLFIQDSPLGGVCFVLRLPNAVPREGA